MNWATKHRPTTFKDVVGQPEKAHLRLLLRDRESFPPVLIFRGPSGTGKTTLARIVAMALNCLDLQGTETNENDPCTKCENCVAIQNDTFTGVYEHNAALENGADAMRGIQEKTFLYSAGDFNVFILDEVQSLSSQAWKVLLKTFEEPVPGNVFILVTSEPNKIPRTISTRSLAYNVGGVKAAEVQGFVEKVLAAENATVEGVDLIVDLANGSVRDAVKMAEQCWRSGESAYEIFGGTNTSLELLEGLGEGDLSKVHQHLDEMWNASDDALFITEQIAEQLKRVLDYSFGRDLTTSAATTERVRKLANVMGERKLSLAFEVLAQWYPRVRHRAHLLFLVTDLYKAVHGGAAAAEASRKVAVAAAAPKKVSPEDAAKQLQNFNLI